MKHSRADSLQEERLSRFKALVREYSPALDLVSQAALGRLDDLVAEAAAFAEPLSELPAGATVLDLGSGAGLPGLVLAILKPELTFLLVERRRRRSSFLRLAAARLGLENTRVVPADVRELAGPEVDAVVSQAAGTPLAIYRQTRHLHSRRLLMVSRRGQSWREEIRNLAEVARADVEVCGARDLGHHATLVAVRIAGGRGCRSSE